jgi:hypothetical protein
LFNIRKFCIIFFKKLTTFNEVDMATEGTTFRAALPWAIGSLALGTAGTILAVGATVTAVKIVGIAAGVIGAYAFFATLICGAVNAGNPKGFRDEIVKYASTMIGYAIADLITLIVREVISSLLDKALGRNNNSIRISQI